MSRRILREAVVGAGVFFASVNLAVIVAVISLASRCKLRHGGCHGR